MVEIKNYASLSIDNISAITTIASGPIILIDGRVILTKNKSEPFWKFPGGTLRDDESPKETAIREAKEETGLQIKLVGEPFIYSFHKEEPAIVKYYVLFHYEAEVIDKIDPTDVGHEIGQFDLNELPDDIAPNVKQALDFFLRK